MAKQRAGDITVELKGGVINARGHGARTRSSTNSHRHSPLHAGRPYRPVRVTDRRRYAAGVGSAVTSTSRSLSLRIMTETDISSSSSESLVSTAR